MILHCNIFIALKCLENVFPLWTVSYLWKSKHLLHHCATCGYISTANLWGIWVAHTTMLWPFVRDYPGGLVSEETHTHPDHQKSFTNLPVRQVGTTIHSILLIQLCGWQSLFATSLQFSMVFLLVWDPLLHTPYISSPSRHLLQHMPILSQPVLL